MGDELLRIEHLHKSFGYTHANNDICLSIDTGEIRSLCGENGSGKSTLTSIISGMQAYDEGKMFLNGEEYRPGTPLEANSRKVSMVVQELGVITSLTGAMNIFLGMTDKFKKGGLVNIRAMEKEAGKIFEQWDLGEVPLNIPCAALTMEQRKIIELARALYIEPDLLILDEITQSLSQDTREIIYRIKDRFKKENRSIIINSHDLDEALSISDRITILRDGEVVDTVSSDKTSIDELKQKMVGRKIKEDNFRDDRKSHYQEELLLKIENLGLENRELKNISFELHKGEIVGICGLSDAGIHTLGRTIFGIHDVKRTGAVIDGRSGKKLNKPGDMLKCKGAYLSKNRDEEGLMMNASIKSNLCLPSVRQLSGSSGYIRNKDVDELANRIYTNFEVKAQSVEQPIGRLSGGNKQKINLGRWLSQSLDYVILDCPTRGVDIGVKAYIYDVINKKRADGMGVILITDELSEAISMADRIIIPRDGMKAGTLDRQDFSENKIIEVML